ncbi:PTS mannitol transporter subunit IICB [Pisciglobus halotolerans]|uniref:PTS system mannitol-specific EIICB component n=1 Tax=Pisciglobus halotolerans TaxID=745365 RepID=A0A1I3AWF1_9LACT|nr:PTS mannitol transporter subunit IICB [Pisciglobus halotolerans]SFH54354.1 PTS system, mannitol-specific IIC component [Pisciglobus halotolerans]
MEQTMVKKGGKSTVQRLGSYLSGMVMPNIGAFIAWGLITALFIPDGWLPNEALATMVDPMLKYLLPVLIAYQGGSMVYGQRGAVVGTIATIGVIMGSDVPMLIGAMALGPLGGYCIKKFDDLFGKHIKTGMEMLVNNFSSGIIGFILAIIAFYAVGPFVSGLTHLLARGVEWIMNAGLLPLANIFIEPAKILFLNNAINHGILTPLGIEQAAEAGKSVLFLLEANPGPGFGLLMAYVLFGKGSAKSSAVGASFIHLIGGIHEIYFPYVLMKPSMFLAVIAGGISGTFTNVLLGSGLVAAASPGSILAVLAMTAKGSYLGVILGVLVGGLVSFLVAMLILKMDKSEVTNDEFEASVQQSQAAKAESKGQAVSATGQTAVEAAPNVNEDVSKIIFACDAGMGSSAMGASLMRKKVQEAGLDISVSNSSINNLKNEEGLLVITQEELTERAKQKTPSAVHVSVDNFLSSPKYNEIIDQLKDEQ